jgi:predicted PhzF superfamily epimerase YddE/YHI9
LTGRIAIPADDGRVKVVFEEEAGLVPVEISRTAGRFHSWLTAPRRPETDPDPPSIAQHRAGSLPPAR